MTDLTGKGLPFLSKQRRSDELYSRRARSYDLLHHVQTLWADSKHRRAVSSSAGLTAAGSSLDIGCGTALAAIEVARRHPSVLVVALDYSAGMLAVAKQNLVRAGLVERVRLVRGDATALPFSDGAFDAVTSTYGFGGIPDPAGAIREVARVLKDGGTACFGEMTAPPASSSALKKLVHRWIVGPWIRHFWAFQDVDLRSLFEHAGLVINLEQYHSDRVLGSMTLVRARKLPGIC
jgi:ubiquinone/menaquinone biosynthesis C-methylase UbiE